MTAVVPFPIKYTQQEAAEFLGISVATLGRERQAGRIAAYAPGRRRVYYLHHDLVAYMERCTKPWEGRNSSPAASEITGYPDSAARHSGIELGSIAELDKRDAKASALKILSAPRSSSPSGTRSTSECIGRQRGT
jgi:excisionase family DNA binding protein